MSHKSPDDDGFVAQPPAPPAAVDRTGLLFALGAYGLWGFLPLFFPLLEPASPLEIVAHRVVWSLLFCLVVLAVTKTTTAARAAVRDRRTLGMLALAGSLLALNWLMFTIAVLTGHTVDASLGYYINPLVTVALAVLVLRERMRTTQWVALGFGTVAVVVITVGYGRLPWIALTLAVTFGLYGLVKNRVGRTVTAVPGLTVETAVVFPFAVGFLVWSGATGVSTFGEFGPWHAVALAATGVITAVPLLLFGAAARRLPLSVVGLMQYLAPTLQLLIGVLVFREEMPAARWWGFGFVWIALVIVTADSLRASRQAARLAAPPPK